MPEGYSNTYYNGYQPTPVLADKTKQEEEGELNRLKGSNASSRTRNNKSPISPKNSPIKTKDNEEFRFAKYGS